MSGSMSGVWKRSHGRWSHSRLRRRTERGGKTDMLDLQPPRHTSTLRIPDGSSRREADIALRNGRR